MPLDTSTLWRAIGRWEAERENNTKRLDEIEPRVDKLEEQAHVLTNWIMRGGLLAVLWIGALMLNLSPEQKSEVISLILQRLTK